VGTTSEEEEGKPPKPLMNPNVAIELGYAYGKLATDCFLPVLNLSYAQRALQRGDKKIFDRAGEVPRAF
jgi:hypothetical protein